MQLTPQQQARADYEFLRAAIVKAMLAIAPARFWVWYLRAVTAIGGKSRCRV